MPIRSPAALVVVRAALTLCCFAMGRTHVGDIWSCGSAERHMSLDDMSMWRCLAVGCTGGPFAGQNATEARFRVAQVKGGGIRVCDGVFDEQLFDVLATDLHRRNEKKGKTVHRALLIGLVAATHIADVAVAVEQSAQRSSASHVAGVAIFPAVSRDEAVFE